MRIWLVSLLAAFVWLAAPAAGAAAAGSDPEPRATMHRIFDALSQLLPASFDERAWTDPAQRDRIRAQLQVLSASAARLEEHAGGRDR